MPMHAVAARNRPDRRRRCPSATPSCAPRSTSSPSAASSTPRSPTSPAPPASPPAPSTSTSEQGRPARLDLRAHDERGARRRPRRRSPASPIRASGCAASRGCTSTASAATATSRRVPGRAAAVDKFMERFSSTLLRDYLGLIRDGDRRRPGRRARSATTSTPTLGRQDVLRRARRNGDQLDPEPPPLLARGRRRRGRRPVPQRRAARDDDVDAPIRSVAVLGAGTMGAQIAAHFANAGVPVAAARPHRRRRARRARSARARSSPIRSSRPTPPRSITTGGFDDDLAPARRAPTGSSKRSSSGSTSSSALLERVDAARGAGHDRQLEHVGHSDRARSPKGRSDDFRRHWLGTHFFNPPRYLHLLELIPTAGHRSGGRRRASPRSPITASARAWSSRRTRRTSSRNHIGLYGVVQMLRRARVAATTRSKRSTRSPARRSAGRRARRSGRWTSPASTSSAT